MVVLTCVSLMASGVGHLFTCLLPIRVSSLENPDPILNLCLEGLGLQEAVPRWREGHSIPSPPTPPRPARPLHGASRGLARIHILIILALAGDAELHQGRDFV